MAWGERCDGQQLLTVLSRVDKFAPLLARLTFFVLEINCQNQSSDLGAYQWLCLGHSGTMIIVNDWHL